MDATDTLNPKVPLDWKLSAFLFGEQGAMGALVSARLRSMRT
jgi:hypothetical protein